MKTYRALGALLTYPTDGLIHALPEIVGVMESEHLIVPDLLGGIRELCEEMRSQELLDMQDDYVRLFDRTRSLSLHLYEHLHGEARERGQAMVRLQTLYGFHGFTHTTSELPDYLPLFAEFLSLMPDRTARTILSDAAPIIEAIHQRLLQRKSSYAPVLGALVSLASRQVDRVQLSDIMRGGGRDDVSFEDMDRAWEDEPITFGAGDAAASAAASQAGR